MAAKRKLRGVSPDDRGQPRLKALFFGSAGVGKTTAALAMPRPYILDAEKGTVYYGDQVKASGGHVFQCHTMGDALEEVRTLLTTDHEFLTVVVDPFTPLYDQALEEGEAKVGSAFGKHQGYANAMSKRLCTLLSQLDMNVIVICHGKAQYDAKGNRLADTFDGWKRLDYLFDLSFEIQRDAHNAKQRLATVRKTRLDKFADGSTFPWGYKALELRLGADSLGRKSQQVELANDEECTEFLGLFAQLTEEDVARIGISKVLASPEEVRDLARERVLKGIDVMRRALNPEKVV